MNLQSGHKRIKSAFTQPYSNTKLNPPDKGTVRFHNMPLKIEGDLTMTNFRNKSKNNYEFSGTINNKNVKPENKSVLNVLNKKNSETVNSTPTKSVIREFKKINFKSNPGNSLNTQNINKLKKLDLNTSSSSLGYPGKKMNKNNRSYYIPKTARDNLNLSNISNKNNSKLNDTNNSFVSNDLLQKSRISNSKIVSRNIKIRSNSPILKMDNSQNRPKSHFTNKPSNVRGIQQSLSKSPMNNLFKSKKSIQSSNKLNQNNLSGISGISTSSKNILENSLTKQRNDSKTNRNITPIIYSSNVKNLKNAKFSNISTKFGGQIKKIVTGNLLSNNTNTNNVSTNTSFLSKLDQINTNVMSNNGTNNSNVGIVISNTNTINSYPKNSISNSVDKKDNSFINTTKNSEKDNINRDKRNNLINEKDKKGNVDFREITTSPLVRKKPEIKNKENEESMLDNPLFSKLNMNKFNLATGNPNSNPTFNGNNLNNVKTVKKNIKLIHEFSKVGFSGNGVKKVNQDNYFVFKNFVGNPNHIFMGVCDGHGILGHEVSLYLRENLPFTLNKQLISKNKNVLAHNVKNVIEDVFLESNYKLQNSEMIDTTFSGSTCVSLIFTPEKIICANVGDSRAVLGKFVNGEWISHNLSRDHKPSDKDESARIKKRGGRIEPFRDEDNSFIGPARVWLKDDDIPGLAMSRSFGDRVAASVGVIAEPEIIEYKLQDEDKFLIIASDGVWEFIESDECINIIKDFYLKNDILECCEYLYKESSTRWMREEEVIDDISMIVVFFEQ